MELITVNKRIIPSTKPYYQKSYYVMFDGVVFIKYHIRQYKININNE